MKSDNVIASTNNLKQIHDSVKGYKKCGRAYKRGQFYSFTADLPLIFSWFNFRSGLVSIQSCFKRSRSLSLCFLDRFFLCWPLVNCWSVQMDVSVCGHLELGAVGAGSVLSSLGIVEDPLSLCGECRRFGLPWRWLLVLSNSSLTCTPEFPWLEELRAPLVPQSP